MPDDRLTLATAEARRIERRGRTRFLRMHLVVRLVVIPCLLGIFALLAPHLVTARVVVMVLGLQAVGLLIVVGMSRSRLIDATAYGLSREQRKQVADSLRRGVVLKDPQLAVLALSQIRQMQRARWAAPLVLLAAGWFFWMSRDDPGGHGAIDQIPTVVALSAVFLAIWVEIYARRGRRARAAYERAAGIEPT
jgi:cbb3-type cytochrome oxidase subunit 3